jgi:phosphoribosylformylglycinamidine synthase
MPGTRAPGQRFLCCQSAGLARREPHAAAAGPLLTGHARGRCATSAPRLRAVGAMKAHIIILPKKAVLDPQGKTVRGALEHLGYTGIAEVRVGKFIEIELTGTDREAARRQLDEACHRFLSNPVIEDYHLEIHD